MPYVKLPGLWLEFCVILALWAILGESISDDQMYDIDLMIEETMKCRRIPGLSLALVSGEDSVTRGYGVADVDTGREADENTVFCTASLGKAFTSTLMAMIIDHRRDLSWDTRIRDLIPDFQLQDPLRSAETTLRDLLAHRTGLQSGDLAFQSGGGVSKENLLSGLKFLNEETPFRGKFVYNNMMYAVLGIIAERLEGKSFEAMLTEKIFQPLNMSSAVFVNSLEKHQENLAKPYTLKGGRFEEIDLEAIKVVGNFPSTGGVCVSANDMGQWFRFLLSGGRDMRGNFLVKERLLRDTMGEHMVLYGGMFSRKLRPRFPVSEINIAYGMGWIPSNYRGFSRVHHSGSLWSYTSHAWLFPNEKVAGFLSMNGPVGSGASRARETIMAYVSDILLGEEPWLNGSTGCDYPQPWEVYPELRFNISNIVYTGPPKRPLVSYTGSFYHPLYGRAVVNLSNSSTGQLHLLIGRVYSAKLFTRDAVDEFLLAFDGILSFLTYSDDKQRIGSVVFNMTDTLDGERQIASSFFIGFPDSGHYEFHRDVNHFNYTSLAVTSAGTASVIHRHLLLLLATCLVMFSYKGHF